MERVEQNTEAPSALSEPDRREEGTTVSTVNGVTNLLIEYNSSVSDSGSAENSQNSAPSSPPAYTKSPGVSDEEATTRNITIVDTTTTTSAINGNDEAAALNGISLSRKQNHSSSSLNSSGIEDEVRWPDLAAALDAALGGDHKPRNALPDLSSVHYPSDAMMEESRADQVLLDFTVKSGQAASSASDASTFTKLPLVQTNSAPPANRAFVDSFNFDVDASASSSSAEDYRVPKSSSSKDIAKVLVEEAFESSLSVEDRQEDDHETCLRIGDETHTDKDLLIVIDSEGENNPKDQLQRRLRYHRRKSKSATAFPSTYSSPESSPSKSTSSTSAAAMEDGEEDSENDSVPDLSSNPDHEDTEGYESDRPMVRASMRKLKPVHMLPPIPSSSSGAPVPHCSYSIPEVPLSSSPRHVATSPVPGPSSHVHVEVLVNTSDSGASGATASTENAEEPPPAYTESAPSTSTSTAVVAEINSVQFVNEVSNPMYGELGARTSSSTNEISSAVVTSNSVNAGVPNTVSDSTTTTLGTSTSTNPAPSDPSSTGRTTGALPAAGAAAAAAAPPPATPGARPVGRTAAVLGPGLRVPQGKWPHRLSSVLALIGCTVGLNSICRFALLSVEFGANFVLQFIFMSLVFGIPLLMFHMSMGQYLSSGIIDMWKISPIFKGIGIGLVISQALVGIYSAIGVSWLLVYFRDSFITRFDQYRWGKCVRDCSATDFFNSTANFSKTVPDYFNTIVLGRTNLDFPKTSSPSLGNIKFTVAFNLALVWIFIFVSMSKGLKSYGKVVHGFVLVPVAGLLILASKLGGLVPPDQTAALFGQTAWANFFFDSQTWVVAAREAFFTWGLLGACVMQITSHNRFTHSLKSDAIIVVLITTFILLLSAFLGNACFSILIHYGYSYMPSSFESNRTYMFLKHRTSSLNQHETAAYVTQHVSYLMGVRIPRPDVLDPALSSGYQVLRLATELFPAAIATLVDRDLSYFWAILFYFTLILFGLAQQIAIWYCVIRGIISLKQKVLRSWEICITFLVCSIGFCLGLPFCTETGIFVEYFMDYVIGSAWWIMVLYLLELIAVFIVRGAPYCGENIVTVLLSGPGLLNCIFSPLISFIWNVILPVAMLVLSITSFKNGQMRELFNWSPAHGYLFWPSVTRELGSTIQLLPILMVPLVAIFQSFRFLTSGPSDMFERMQQLYRPNTRGRVGRQSSNASSTTDESGFASRNTEPPSSEDPPPKYTPPPSYSTATGAKIARFLRSSIRRSMRRLAGTAASSSAAGAALPPPPNYATVIMEINSQRQSSSASTSSTAQQPTLVPIVLTNASSASGAEAGQPKNSSVYQMPLSRTLGRALGADSTKERSSLRRIASDITPRDIARILRASFRRSTNYNSGADSERVDNYTTNVTIGDGSVVVQNACSNDQNNLNFQREATSGGGGGGAAAATSSSVRLTSTLNIEDDFLRVPSYESAMAMATGSSVFTISDSAYDSTATHGRSSSLGSALMSRGQVTTESQLTLISHSSSQSDLTAPSISQHVYSQGVSNPAFAAEQRN